MILPSVSAKEYGVLMRILQELSYDFSAAPAAKLDPNDRAAITRLHMKLAIAERLKECSGETP